MIWKRPKSYGLINPKELKESGFTNIKKLLKLKDEQQIFTCCNDDVSDLNVFFKIWGDLVVDGSIVKENFKGDTLLIYNDINFVVSNYEGDMRSISFSFKDFIKVKKQVLFDKLI